MTREADDDVVELTRALVSIPSVNPELEGGGDGELKAAEFCARLLREWGFQVERFEPEPRRVSLVARLGQGSPTLLLNGHLDTVGVEGMEVSPFDPQLRDGLLYGRGSCDMKGGVAAILVAARELARSSEPLRGTLLVVLTADEEHASLGLGHLRSVGLSADMAVVCEPTSLAVMPANKGFEWWTVECLGRAAHGSRPELGRDAIRMAGRFLAELDGYERELAAAPLHPLLRRGSIHAGTIRGGTTPPVYPRWCELVLEARILPGEARGAVEERLEATRARVLEADPTAHILLRKGLGRPATELPEDHPVVAELLGAAAQEGIQPRVEGMTAWVESSWFVEMGIPAVCFGPGSLEKAHTADEFVPVEELHAAAAVLLRFGRHLLS